jgi:hypothetical protein
MAWPGDSVLPCLLAYLVYHNRFCSAERVVTRLHVCHLVPACLSLPNGPANASFPGARSRAELVAIFAPHSLGQECCEVQCESSSETGRFAVRRSGPLITNFNLWPKPRLW